MSSAKVVVWVKKRKRRIHQRIMHLFYYGMLSHAGNHGPGHRRLLGEVISSTFLKRHISKITCSGCQTGEYCRKKGSPYKTVRVNNFNKLHTMVLAAHVEKSGVYKVEQGGIFKPALLSRDYPILFIRRELRAFFMLISLHL